MEATLHRLILQFVCAAAALGWEERGDGIDELLWRGGHPFVCLSVEFDDVHVREDCCKRVGEVQARRVRALDEGGS